VDCLNGLNKFPAKGVPAWGPAKVPARPVRPSWSGNLSTSAGCTCDVIQGKASAAVHSTVAVALHMQAANNGRALLIALQSQEVFTALKLPASCRLRSGNAAAHVCELVAMLS
jgi:hypothetical protein